MAFPAHEVHLDEIVAAIRRSHPDHPKLAAMLRIVGSTGVERRRFARPLDQVVRTEPIQERNDRTFADLCDLGERAARAALADNGLEPGDVDCVITSHSTGIAIPGLDVVLMNRLGMRPGTRRIPTTQLGCAGGAYALVRAADFLVAHPGSRILVVVAEVLSTVYQDADDSIPSMIYRVLFGDSASAAVVTDTPRGSGLRIHDTWEYTLPHTTDRYELRLDGTGQHFDSIRESKQSVKELTPPMMDWYWQRPGTRLDFVVAHTGGPAILQDLELGLACEPKLLAHSWDSLHEEGNLGGAAVFSVLDRHFASPPAHGDQGLLVGVGPGFSAAACRVSWHSR